MIRICSWNQFILKAFDLIDKVNDGIVYTGAGKPLMEHEDEIHT